jgi:hypothetical protein
MPSFYWFRLMPYDVINPLGDDRSIDYTAIWTFDLVNDILFYTNHSERRRIPLALLRARTATWSDMEILGPTVPLPVTAIHPPGPMWQLDPVVDARIQSFTHPLFRDFNHQWRHILRSDYNSYTRRVLGRAIIRLAMLDVDIQELESRSGMRSGAMTMDRLPEWSPLEDNIVRIGGTIAVFCSSTEEGLRWARSNAREEQQGSVKSGSDTLNVRGTIYLILSIRHIVLSRTGDSGTLEHTSPEPLFNGNYHFDPPSDRALNYLLWATNSARVSIPTIIPKLPVEITDSILHWSSAGPVRAALIGCQMHIGSEFRWKDGQTPLALLDLSKGPRKVNPVVSRVCLNGDHCIGLVYTRLPAA